MTKSNIYPSRPWGLAAAAAYRAYKQDTFLDLAMVVWNETNQYLLTQDEADSGSHPLISAPIESECNGGMYCAFSRSSILLIKLIVTTAGAVFLVCPCKLSPYNVSSNIHVLICRTHLRREHL